MTYAGFWKRLAALLIDFVVMLVLSIPVWVIIALLLVAGGSDGFTPLLSNAMSVAIAWAYFAGFESSRLQATPGKFLLKIQVADSEGGRITLGRATIRHFAKTFSALILFIGYLMAAFTRKKQALHDKAAFCLVINRPAKKRVNPTMNGGVTLEPNAWRTFYKNKDRQHG